jgi:hypothetical protein
MKILTTSMVDFLLLQREKVISKLNRKLCNWAESVRKHMFKMACGEIKFLPNSLWRIMIWDVWHKNQGALPSLDDDHFDFRTKQYDHLEDVIEDSQYGILSTGVDQNCMLMTFVEAILCKLGYYDPITCDEDNAEFEDRVYTYTESVAVGLLLISYKHYGRLRLPNVPTGLVSNNNIYM